MAPEQGPDSKSHCGKKETSANEEESGQNYENSKYDKPSTSDTLQKDSVGWIYILRKDQLIEQCRNAGIPTTGFTVEHLRRQLSENLRTKRMRASTENLGLRELEEQIQTVKSVVYEENISLPVPAKPSRCDLSDTEIMMSIQKWNLNYSGETDLMEFLERFEELAESYHIPFDRLLPSMLSILSGNALKWYRVKRETINTWANLQTGNRKVLPTQSIPFAPRTKFLQPQTKWTRTCERLYTYDAYDVPTTSPTSAAEPLR
ncbi:hypothetical protein CVS40_9876 [Lucilia cuprina]|nr:hypothetical protein CVS40_9876 [Lucilia cuprina]